MSSSGNVFVDIINAFDTIIDGVIGGLPFPINAALAFLWGGISAAVIEIVS